MSHGRDAPERGVPSPDAPAPSSGVVDLLRRHVAEWPRRYVEMRVDAVDED